MPSRTAATSCSPSARTPTRFPGLQIEADDVACTHAAAIAQIDPEQLFYLTSRGLDRELASELIVGGFLAELVERVPKGPVADALAEALEQRLGQLLA